MSGFRLPAAVLRGNGALDNADVASAAPGASAVAEPASDASVSSVRWSEIITPVNVHARAEAMRMLRCH